MKLRLQEAPREWMKFTGVMALLVSVLGLELSRRGLVEWNVFFGVLGLAGLAVGLSWIRPRWFRGFYRGGMTVSWHLGQGMGRVVLTVIFFVVVTPMGLFLRLTGKDLLGLSKPAGDSYWRPAPKASPFDQLF